MDPMVLLPLQMATSLVAWGLVAVVAVVPRLRDLPRERALLLLALPQMFRHLGTNQLSPMVGPDMPASWAYKVAIGDSVTVVLAMIAVVLLLRGHRAGVAAAWVMNVVGVLDLLTNGATAAAEGIAPHLGAAWYIVAFGVPLMLWAHGLSLWKLLAPPVSRDGSGASAEG